MSQETEVSRRGFIFLTAGVAAGAAAVGIAALTEEQTTDKLTAHYVEGTLPDDPEDGAWGAYPSVEVALQPQQMATPMLPEAVVPWVKVRAVHNGQRVAFQLRWDDPDDDAIEAMARFKDAVAVELPTTPEPGASSMGQPGGEVQILLWRASWQRDVDRGRQHVEDAFPNMYAGPRPEDLMDADQAEVFYPGRWAGNALSAEARTTPVEEATAAGFGSLTTMDEQRGEGKGVRQSDGWSVVVSTPMQGGEGRAKLAGGQRTKVAFAVWNGGAGNRGSRKQWADWVDLRIEGAQA